jgi:hypothetical protein
MRLTGRSRARVGHSIMVLAGCTILSVSAQMSSMAQTAPKQQALSRDQYPIAIAALSSGELAVLESRGALSLLDPTTDKLTRIKETLGNFVPLDMVAGHVADQDAIFVTLYWAISTFSTQTNQGLVIQYSRDGRETHKWSSVGHIFGGLAIDARTQLLYLGSASSADLFTLNVNAEKPPIFVAHVAGASRLGALALDSDQHRLFVCDVGSGNIHVFDLMHHKSHLLVSGLGDAAALVYEPSQHKLYVADASRHTVWQISVDAVQPKPNALSSASQLREPRGLALGQNKTLWVADYAARAIFQLSSTGQVIASAHR